MNRAVAAPGKRKRSGPDPAALSSDEQIILDLILSKEGTGITDYEMKRQIQTIPAHAHTKAIKSLKTKSLIKEVKSLAAGRKVFMGISFKPSDQISGGIWYSEGKMDDEYISTLRGACRAYLKRNKVATLDALHKQVDQASNEPVPQAETAKLLEMMVLNNEVVEVKSTGLGEFARIRVGETCYKLSNAAAGGDQGTPITGAYASIPCGVCPVRDFCTPDGEISPSTCVYYTKWFDISF